MKHKKESHDLKDIPVLSFFTGGGFLDMGFVQAGFRVVWSNEYDSVSADLYSHGMTGWMRSLEPTAGQAKISDTRNIANIFAPEIMKAAFPNGKPKIFGFLGGPPCPDFSVGGKNKGGEGINGRLSKTYVERICKIKPAFFVFENVPGLYNTRIHREFLTRLEHKLERAGYCLDIKVLNALEAGVPQDRDRLIMIGIKRALVGKCLGRRITTTERGWFSWPQLKYRNAKKTYVWPSTVERGTSPVKPSAIPEELTVYHWINSNNPPEKIPNGKDTFKAKSEKFHVIEEGDTNRKSFKRLHRFRYSPTVCYGHNEVHLHPWKHRRLSVREAMRIQGIPDTYVLPEDASLSAKFRVISNGVPVPLAYEVARSLKTFLRRMRQNGYLV